MVLVLSRGAFCPKDRRQAEGLLQLHREMEVGYCRLVTISTDNITQTNENRSGIGAHWPFLSDPQAALIVAMLASLLLKKPDRLDVGGAH